jgi:hypothetical protein
MPFRLDEFKAKIQFVAPANFPALINRAAEDNDVPSQTRYIQLALCRQLAEDLGMDEGELIRSLPPTKGMSAALFGGDRRARSRRAPRIGR